MNTSAERESPRERPILFSGPMVRAILDGRKTQTRRILRRSDVGTDAIWLQYSDRWTPYRYELCRGMLDQIGPPARSPYGVPGDRLWVRETWCELVAEHRDRPAVRQVVYRADQRDATGDSENCRLAYIKAGYPYAWRPSIYMPRWASRLTLEVTGVRVERLQAITEVDAEAEGCEPDFGNAYTCAARDFRRSFERLWDEINGKRAPWSSNPWVWVVTFRRLA